MSNREPCGGSTTPSRGRCAKWRPLRPSRQRPNLASSSGFELSEKETTMSTTYRVTLKYPDGTTLFMGTVLAEEITDNPAKDKPVAKTSQPDNGDRMTDPQKRYLFRLLAAQNIEGKKAEEHLKSYFEVSRLSDVSRAAASQYIDHIVKDRKDAAS